ncbi:hypothetical protein [Parasphingopyxis sp.]|uniref:hypothetical protein n=1 Tax=Parasphingopyxis sp. TaxID=1920299 RepID=UPI002622DD83|nr:hypothetical protein [Parasphingopyxis sp.]
MRQLDEVERLFEQHFEGEGDRGVVEYVPGFANPTNQNFNQASQRLLALVRPAIAMSAREGDSDREMAIFESYIPSSTSFDVTNRNTINTLRSMLENLSQGVLPSETEAQMGGSQRAAPANNAPQSGVIPPQEVPPRQDVGNGLGNMAVDETRRQVARSTAIAGLGENAGQERGIVEAGDDRLLSAVDELIRDPNVSTSQIVQFLSERRVDLTPEQVAAIRFYKENPDQPAPDAVYDGEVRDATMPEAYLTGAADFLTAGFGDELGLYDSEVANQAQEDRPLSYFGGQLIAGGLTTPAAAVATPGRAAATASAFGGAHSAGSTDGDVSDRLSAAGRGAVLGGATGYLGQRFVGSLSDRIAARTQRRAARQAERSDVFQAAQRQGIDPLPADVGGPATRRLSGGAAQGFVSGPPVIRAAEAANEATGDALARTAQNVGNVADRTGAGQAAQRGAREFLDESARRERDLFEAVPIPDDTAAVTTNSREALQEIAGQFESNPRLREAFADERLATYAQALEDGLSYQDLRAFRSRIGEMVESAQVGAEGSSRASLRRLYGALSDDITETARAVSPRALALANRAVQYSRGRHSRREGVLRMILGRDFNATPEQAFNAIERLTTQKGSVSELSRALRSMPASEAASVRATMIERLGLARAGGQNADGDAFSIATFLTNWNNMSPRARAVLAGNQPTSLALNDLARYAGAAKDSARYANSSNTTGAVLTQSALTSAPAIFMQDLTGVLLAGTALGAQYGAGRLLASPSVARWMARAPRQGARPSRVRAWIRNAPKGIGLQPQAREALEALFRGPRPAMSGDDPEESAEQ